MTTTKIDVLTPEQKEQERERIAEDIKQYLAKGGKITQCPRNAYTTVNPDGKPTYKRKFDKIYSHDSITDPTKRTLGGFIPSKGGK
jgi:hypothetical protein